MAEHNFSVENTLTLLLDDKKYHSLRDILSTMNPADIAAVFDELPESRLPLLFRLLPKELAAETFVEMDTDAQALLIRGFSDSELKEVIDELYVDDAVDIVEEMPAKMCIRDSLAPLHVVIFCVALEFARADAHERQPVAVRLVHVRLNLEDERRKIGAERVNLTAVCHTRQRARRHAQKLFQKRLHAEVCQRRAEEHRRKLAALYLRHIKLAPRAK